MTAEQLRNSILQEAISGRLIPQDPNDEPASALLARIREEKARLVKEGKLKKKDLVETPITAEEIPFEIPASWEWCRIHEISQSYIGLTYSPADVSEDGIIVLRSSNIKSGKLTLNDIVRVKKEINEKLQVALNDIIICARNGSRKLVGKSALITEMSEPMTFGAFMAICKTPFYSFVYQFLQSNLFFSQLRKVSDTTTINQLTQNNFNSFLIPLPPLAEQKRIVAKLEELLPIVEQYGKAQKELDELNTALPARLRQSILQEAISGKLVPQDENDEPASVLLGHIQTEKQRLVKEKILKAKDIVVTPIPEDELPFDIPETWSWCRLGELAFERMGKTPPRGESEYWLNAKYPWVSISDMKDYGHVKTTKEGVSEIAAQKAFRQISPIGSLLMSFKLTVGRTAILDIDAYHNEAIITIQPYVDKEYAFRNYLFYVLPLLANLGDSKDAIKGKTLNSTSLFNLYIPLPPLAEQQRIVAKIEELFAEIDKLK